MSSPYVLFFMGYKISELFPNNWPIVILEKQSNFQSNVLLIKLFHFSEDKTRGRNSPKQMLIMAIPEFRYCFSRIPKLIFKQMTDKQQYVSNL